VFDFTFRMMMNKFFLETLSKKNLSIEREAESSMFVLFSKLVPVTKTHFFNTNMINLEREQ
jgi:hypothetical protein